MRKRDFLLRAEECDGEFYQGWWFYLDPIVDGEPVQCNDSLWLRDDEERLEGVRRLAEQHGAADLPDNHECPDAFAEAFAKVFPEGLVVRGTEADRCLCVSYGWVPEHVERTGR